MHKRGFLNHLFAALVLTAMVVSSTSIYAQNQSQALDVNVFEVRDVAVDVTAETAAVAREQARAEGKARAFQRLMERLTLRIEHSGLPQLSAEEISPYVKDFSVADEKTSSVRYLARLTFHFKPKEVRGLLTESGFSFAETVSKPVLVLPVFQNAGALILWDEPNPWREAWNARSKTRSLVPTLLPLGDLADIATIGADQAMDGDQQRLAALAKRYGASDTLVVFGVMRIEAAQARRVLDVYFTRFGRQLQEQTEVISFPQKKGETVSALLARASQELTYVVEDNWKRDNLLQFDRADMIPVMVSISGLKEWIRVRARLDGVAVLQRTELVLLSKELIHLNLHFIGETNQLALALEQADLKLAQENDQWRLSLAVPITSAGPKSK
ncbi:MAG TPA: DUF2066 domain-containing protein [Rhodospirillales bacterium]|jgi:hypothetical protein|nr:DUF2066 domain-containing protein [Rhodospirillales bacterium]